MKINYKEVELPKHCFPSNHSFAAAQKVVAIVAMINPAAEGCHSWVSRCVTDLINDLEREGGPVGSYSATGGIRVTKICVSPATFYQVNIDNCVVGNLYDCVAKVQTQKSSRLDELANIIMEAQKEIDEINKTI